MLECNPRPEDDAHEATRVRYASRRRCGCMAAHRAGAAASHAPVVGVLSSETLDLSASRVRALRQGLSESGYVEGRNVEIEHRWAENQYDRLPTLAADLVHRQVSVIA